MIRRYKHGQINREIKEINERENTP